MSRSHKKRWRLVERQYAKKTKTQWDQITKSQSLEHFNKN